MTKEEQKEKRRQYNQTHKEERREYQRQWQRLNREKMRGYAKKYYHSHKEKTREYQIQHRYGISGDDFLAIWDNQGGRCAICRKSFAKQFDVCIDHCHKTGKVRGLLCRNCNIGLGHFGEEPEVFNRIVKYLM